MLTQARLKELYYYYPHVGTFRNLKTNKISCAKLKMKVDNQQYYVSHLAWLYVYGELPMNNVAHKNHDLSDNRICNIKKLLPSRALRHAWALQITENH